MSEAINPDLAHKAAALKELADQQKKQDLVEKRRKAEGWVNGYTAGAVAAVVAASPVPGAATAILCGMEATMCYQIGRIYKANWSMGEAATVASAIGVGLLPISWSSDKANH